MGLDRRDAGAVVAHHGNAVAELMAEHDQGALEALGDVGALHRSTVHLRVGLDRGDER